MDTCSFILISSLEVPDCFRCTDISDSATWYDTFLDSRTCSAERILDTVLLLFHLHFSSSTYIEYSHTARELAETFLEFLAVIIRCGGLDLLTDKVSTFLNGISSTGTVNYSSIILCHYDLLCLTQHIRCGVFKAEASFLRDYHTSCENCDILKHFLTTVTEAWSLDSCDLKGSAELVHHESCKSFTINIFCDDKKSLSLACYRLKNRKKVLHCRDLLVCHENIWSIQNSLHLVTVCHEIRRNVSSVELHSFHNLHLCLCTFCLLDCDYTILLHL